MATTKINANNIPPELRQLDQWVCWTTEERDGKPTKIPKLPGTDRNASTTNPDDWTDFLSAFQWFNGGNCDGIGFVFTKDDPYVGIDLDSSRNPKSNAVEKWADEIVTKFGSYTEISPSETGLHIICKGELPGAGRHVGNIEIYDRGRYFTMTGRKSAKSDGIRDCRSLVLELYHSLESTGKTEKPAEPVKIKQISPSLSDDEVIKLASEAKNADKFQRLMDGDASEYPSQSEADGALVMMIGFYTQKLDQIVSIMQRSKLWDDKWERPDYQERTINSALAKMADFYGKFTATVGAATVQREEPGEAPEVVETEPAAESETESFLLKSEPERLTDLLKQDLPDPPMIIGRGLVPAFDYTILASYTKTGKTTFAMQMALSIVSGTDFLGFPIENSQVNILYCYLENTRESLAKMARQQIEGWGSPVNCDRLHLLESRGVCLQLGEGLKFLKANIEKTSADLVVIDPVSLAMQRDINDIATVRTLVHILQSVVTDRQIAWLLIHHYGKPTITKRQPIQAMLGSSGWGNYAESFIGIDRWSDRRSEDYRRLNFKPRHGPPIDDICVYFNQSSRLFELVEDPDNIPAISINRVIDILKDHGQPVGYTLFVTLLKTNLGISERTAKQLITAAKESGKIVKEEGKFGKYFLF